MKINVADIIKVQGATKEISVIEESLDIPKKFHDMELCGPVQLTGELESDNGNIHLSGILTAQVKVQCARCMCDMTYNIQTEVAESFGSTIEGIVDHAEPIVQSTIDLRPTFVETLLISLPMKSLCDDNCKGMCTACGQNLNEQSCDCDTEYTDPRLEKLGLLFSNTQQEEKNKEV